MQELRQEDVDTLAEQRRLRHLTEVLVRNLSIPASFAPAAASLDLSSRPSLGRNAYSSSFAGAVPPIAGPSSTALHKSERPSYIHRRSKDDLDLPISTLHKRHPARRKLTISNEGRNVFPVASSSDYAQNHDHRPSSPAGTRLDVKGKGRESDLASSRDTLDIIQEGEGGEPSDVGGVDGLPPDDSDLVFGWTSANKTSAPLSRSRSKSSLKSSSSKRSLTSTVSKRLFKQNRRRRSSLIGSDEDDGSDESENDSPRRGHGTKYERPQSPLSPHVSFRMAIEHGTSYSSSVGPAPDLDIPASINAASRARSASRGSILSVASGSSASTIRASTFRHSERAERLLLLKRCEDVRSHLVRSRLTLSLPKMHITSPIQEGKLSRPAITRTRTYSLPLRGETSESTRPNEMLQAASQVPFYVSAPHKRSMEPSFPLDFSSRASLGIATAAAVKQHKVLARIWVESEVTERSPDKETWKLLFEWEVDLRRLISLGTDPRLFPRKLPANTLIFKTSTTDEYLTARLPAFMLSDTTEQTEEGIDAEEPLNDGDDVEDEGNLSDPGPASASSVRRRARHGGLSLRRDVNRDRERLLARRKMIMDRSVRETRMVQSVDDEEFRTLIEREQEMQKLRADNMATRENIDNILGDTVFDLERQRNGSALIVEKYASDKIRLESDTQATECMCKQKRQRLNDRSLRLSRAREVLHEREASLHRSRKNHKLDLDVYQSIRLSASQRRAGLIGELSGIFPVDLVDAANVLFSICGIPLPNGDFEAQQTLLRSTGLDLDDDHISSALGYVAQAVQLLAAYLTVPLYYPLRCVGSRSLVQDPISQMKGPKIFPLYSRGVDRFRFEYAVFLLNKDIEQIMLEYNIGVMELTQTLPNLKNIYLTLSSDASTSGKDQKPPAVNSLKSGSARAAIVLDRPDKLAEQVGVMNLDPNSDSQSKVADVPQVNGNIASKPNVTSTSALEKILGGSWHSRTRVPSSTPDADTSSVKGRRRHAEASKTMTLLGGRSSANHI